MSTIASLSSSETLNPISLGKINTNFSTLNTDKLEASDIAGKQDTLVSWTNIKSINSVSLLWSGDLSIPTLTDWDKGDIVLSSSATVWTIDNDVVTNAKLANVASATFKGRTTVGTGDPEDLTATQATALLNTATTSLKGLMSSTDKTKLDWLANEWTLLTSSSYTAGGTYDSSTLTSYDLYKVVITWTSTWSSTFIWLRVNNEATWSSYAYVTVTASNWSISNTSDWYFPILNHNSGSWYPFYGEYIITKTTCQIWSLYNPISVWSVLYCGTKAITVTSIQLSLIQTITGNIKIYGKNY